MTPFSYEITSITSKKARIISADSKEYSYSKIKKELYWGFEKKEGKRIFLKVVRQLDCY